MQIRLFMKVLLVEDDNITGHIMMKVMEGLGYEPLWYTNGAEALAWIEVNPCQIVISDWMMPGLDGIELCKKIRALKLPIYTYFILLTAKIPVSEGCKVLATGVDAFISKPLDKKSLVAKLNVAQSIIRNSHPAQVA